MSVFNFAQDKPANWRGRTPENVKIQTMLDFYGLRTWGFVVYRCTYDDERGWNRFMAHLNGCKDAALIAYYRDPELAGRVDWSVQEDLSLDGASKDVVRERFRNWVDTAGRAEMPGEIDEGKLKWLRWENTRYKYCVHVDQGVLDSVPDHGDTNAADPVGSGASGSGYVNLIRADEAWYANEGEKAESGKGGKDEGEGEIEGRKEYDVGWMKVKINGLLPEVYEKLITDGSWDHVYIRPDQGVYEP